MFSKDICGKMESLILIKAKLTSFIRKFYLNQLLKGVILFVATGLLYFVLVLFIEHILWLNTFWRGILFWVFILMEVALFTSFIIVPLFGLFKLAKGLDELQASRMIGSHFPEVGDKLLNIIQLAKDSRRSDLLEAGIEQKSNQVQPIPFSSAVDFRDSLKFFKFAAVPVLIILLVVFSGNFNFFTESYGRVIHYNKEFEPPAPFSFVILNEGMEVREDEPFVLEVQAVGKVLPEEVMIRYEDQTYFLESKSQALFQHSFDPLEGDVEFVLSGNGVISGPHIVEVIEVPRMLDFEMHLDYPEYTNIKDELRVGTGNATIPEGTRVSWKLETEATDEVLFVRNDSVKSFTREKGVFLLKKDVYKDLLYQVNTSNRRVKEYESLDFWLKVTKDQYPVLDLLKKRDSMGSKSWHFHGKVSDDYGILKVVLVYYKTGDPGNLKRVIISKPKGSAGEFLSSFPDSLKLEKGSGYEFYFQVYDNDMLRNAKSIKSEIFSYRQKTDMELEHERMLEQSETIKGMNEILEGMDKSKKELNEISRLQKENSNLNYNDRKKLEGFIERRKKQNESMKRFTEKLRGGLENDQEEDNELRSGLEKRLNTNDKKLDEDEKLLQELEEVSDKIDQEGLGERLEQLSKNKRNEERNLEQLLELTKRYYVDQSLQRAARELDQLSKEQRNLSEERLGGLEKQDSLMERFEDFQESLDKLEEENKELKQPVNVDRDRTGEDEIKEHQKKARKHLEQDRREEAGDNQKKASEKMKEMSEKIRAQQKMGSMEMMVEDSDALRQILDNLIVFSFEQEDLLESFKAGGEDDSGFGGKLKKQNILKEHFQHVDDSLYSLAMRNPMVNEDITTLVTDVIFNLEKSLERLAQNEISRGMGSQQYVVASANELALLLSGILGKMQDMTNPASGTRGLGDIQLSDIIKRQEELNKEMKNGLKNSKQDKGKGEEGSSEKESQKLFEIFKEQQLLRRALEEELKKGGAGKRAEELEKEMESVEEDLLKDGFSQDNLEQMLHIEQRLLDMEEAEMERGEESRRESQANDLEYRNNINRETPGAEEYFQMNEILNRQILPLRQIYKRKVQEYFELRSD